MIVFYILSGEKYIDLARKSAMSVSMHMPDVERILFTPDDNIENGQEFSRVIPLPKRCWPLWYLDCLNYLSIALDILKDMGLEKLLYLDADTFMVEPVYELSQLLDKFDLVAAHAPGRVTCKTVHPMPDCFPELNIGVMGLYNKPPLRRFVNHCFGWYYNNQLIYGENDQGSLREGLYRFFDDDFRFYVLPPEYNVRPLGTGCFLKGKARIIHSNSPNILDMAASVNADIGMRVWKP